jgi:hypothetical protein
MMPRLGVSREIAGPSRGFASNFREARWFAVLSCYLDDSGTDESNPVVTVAGYIARDDIGNCSKAMWKNGLPNST